VPRKGESVRIRHCRSDHPLSSHTLCGSVFWMLAPMGPYVALVAILLVSMDSKIVLAEDAPHQRDSLNEARLNLLNGDWFNLGLAHSRLRLDGPVPLPSGKLYRDRLTQPTLVTLPLRHMSLESFVRTLDGQNGLKLELQLPINDPRRERELELEAITPITFWQAIEFLCREFSLTHVTSSHALSPEDVRPIVYLVPRETRVPSIPSSLDGPFRVCLSRSEVPADSALGGMTGGDHDGLRIILRIEAEPRMLLIQDGHLCWREAVDDKGLSLARPTSSRSLRWDNASRSGFYSISDPSFAPRLTLTDTLHPPAESSRNIKRLRGVLPVVVAVPGPDLLDIPAVGAENRLFSNDWTTIRIHSIEAGSVSLTVTHNAHESVWPLLLAHQIRLLDRHGQLLKITHMNIESDAKISRVRIALLSTTTPARLLFNTLTEAEGEVTFAFCDVSLQKPQP
jgi:hypothetical protein